MKLVINTSITELKAIRQACKKSHCCKCSKAAPCDILFKYDLSSKLPKEWSDNDVKSILRAKGGADGVTFMFRESR